VSSGEYEIHYETHGGDDAPTILLVMGLGAQLTAWRSDFVEPLVDAGYQVVRYDNRDVGFSTRTDGPPPSERDVAQLALRLRNASPPYTLNDMAADGIAVLDDLGVDAAHIVGASMGGMIAQIMAIEHRSRLRSLTSIMSTTGSRRVGRPTPKTLAITSKTPPTTQPEAFEHSLRLVTHISGPGHAPERLRERVQLDQARAFHPAASIFHAAAVLAAPDRTRQLRQLDVPTLVLHGRKDVLVTLSGGQATAAAIPNATLVVFNEMGHAFPPALLDPIHSTLLDHFRRTDAQSTSAGRSVIQESISAQ